MAPDNAMAEKEAAQFLGVSPSFLAKRRVSGDGPQFVKYGGKRVVYLRLDLEAWRNAQRRTSTMSDQTIPARAA
jgi:predicted DNA-binding transcriptional regulator AlpA